MANRGAYGFNGTFYNTREEAEAAREQAKAAQEAENRQRYAQYIDAYSVGFDKNKYDALIASGQGVSQISDNEANYIRSKFTPSYSTKYKNSVTDQYLASVGLPPSADLSKYREQYTNYTSSGSAQDVYGFLSNDDWNKINELWSKDWQYGLTNEDFIRQQYGYAPVSYDSMYEDTLLDDQLKAAHLPPSKLLNGKLGEAYTTYVNNGNKYNEFMTDAINRKIEEDERLQSQSKNPVMPSVNGEVEERQTSYSLEQAINDMRTSDKWSAWAAEHFGTRMELPDQFSDDYLMMDDSGYVALRDANGQKMYDYDKYNKDLKKAQDNNAKLDADDWAITYDKAQSFYDQNYSTIKSLYDAQNQLAAQGISAPTQEQYLDAFQNAYIANSINGGNGFTVDDLFPNLDEQDKGRYQKYVDKTNMLMRTQGYNAAVNYINGGELASELRAAQESEWVAAYRKEFADVEEAQSKTDEQIIQSHYDKYKTEYGMTDEEVKQLRDGSLSLPEYLGANVKTSEDAQTFATDRIARELASKGLPTTQDELKKESDRLAEQIENLSFAEIEFVPEDRFFSEQELAKFRSEVTPEYYNDYINEKKRERLNELASKKSEIDVTLNTWHAKETAYYIDAVQYTDDFKKKTEDMEYVNEQFNKIVDGWNNSLFGGEADALKSYATDDEKRALVYLADSTMYSDKYVPDANGDRTQVSYKARNYLNDVLMRGWDMKRNQQKIEQQDWYNDEDTSIVWKLLGGAGRTLAAITIQPTEAVVNAMFDTARMIGGKDIYASSRMTWADTEISNIANHISEDAGQGWATAYQMIPSMAQSTGGAVLAYFTGGASAAATLALMATQSYSSTVNEALQNGASSKEAFAYGIAAGVAEALFEEVSLESLTTGMKGVSDVLATATDLTKKEAAKQIVTTMLKNTVVQGLTEGSEEVFTSLANNLTEKLILGYNSSAEKLKRHYLDAGLSEEEASRRVLEDNVKSIAMDFALGVASGALMAFGSNLVITGNTVKMDSYKLDSFMHDVHDLSAVPVNEAVTYAKNNAKITNDGITVDSAREVFSELYRKGADAATLSRVRNEVTTENTGSDVMTEIDSIIRKASVRDQKSLINAASKALAKKGVSQQQINSAVESYVNQLSTVVQQSDYAAIDASVAQMQEGFINDLIRNSGRTSVQGAQIINDYIKQNQDAVKAGAREYINKFNANKNLSKAQAADYANYASALTLMTSDQNFVTALVSQFGEQASNVSEAVRNAVLNSADGASTQFVQAVVDSVGQIEMNSNETSLTSIFSQDMDMTAYVAAQLAMAAQHKENAASRSIYDNITMYGTSEAMLDTLTAVNRYEGILAKQRSAANAKANAATDAIKPTSDVATKNARKTKARKNAANKKAAVESRKARNAEAEAESASNVARYDAEYDSFFSDNRIDADGNIVRSIPANMVEAAERVNAAREQAISAYSKLIEENRGRLLGAETDSRNADDEYMELAKEVNGAFDVYSAAYVNMFGAQIEAMRAGKSVSTAEMNRLTALVQNGVTADINSVTAKINAAEKRSAVALGNALGADVEIASFTKEFAKERGIDVLSSDSGFTQNGKIYLNDDMFNGTVGYGTGAVLQHEFAHVLETSAEQYSRYERFALDYLTKTQGKDFVKNAVKATIESAAAKGRTLTEEAAQHEIVAEFSRTYMLTDPRAINAMCSKAPVMSTRILQWLTNTKAAFGNGVSQGSLLNRAQLAYARALKKLDVKADSPSDITSVQNANAAFDNEQSVIKANPEIKTEAVATTEATEQKAEQTKEEPKAPDGYEFVNNEEGYEWTDQTVPASEMLSDEELAASYDEVLNEEEARVTAEEEAATEEEAPAEQTEEAEQLAETEAQPEAEPAVETEEAEQPTEDFAEYAEETVAENATAEQAEPQAEETQTASLPFDLPQNTIDTISRFVEIQKSKAVGGKVSADVNDTIRGVVKYQVNKAAKEAGVTVTDEQIKQYADTWTLEQSSAETKKAGSSWIDNYKPTKTKTRTTAESFMNAAAVEEKQENTLRKAVNGLGGEQRVMYGTPKVLNEGKGVMVSRTVSVKGLQTGNANADGDRTIAMIARADKFLFGNDVDLRRSLKLEDCYAVVIPNSTAYANIREQAREAGLVVMSYDSADALSFDRAQKSAARSSAVQYFPDSGTTLEALIKKYGAHPVGSEPRVDNRPMPKRTSDTNRVSRAMRTVAEANMTSDEMYDYLTGAVADRGVGTYIPQSNSELLNTAKESVSRFANIMDASNALHNEIREGKASNAEMVARAETLLADSMQDNSLTNEQRDQIVSDLAILSKDTATALQLFRQIKLMTPEGRINYLNTIGEREAAKYKKRTGKNVTLTVTEEEAEAIRKARNNEERSNAEEDVMKRWEEEMPLTLADHIRNWRYLSMLGNPRTHFRNMIGNVLMYGAARAKDIVNTGYQRLFNVDEADRTTSWKMGAPSEAAKTFVSDVLKDALPTMQGVSEKYIQNSKSNTDITKGKTWIGRLLNNLAAFNSNALEAEDKNFLSLRFKSAMYQMIRAQNIDVNNITDEQKAKLIGYASEEALRATFRDANKVADALNKAAGSSKIVEYALEAIVPFKKTPANIVKRSIEYSPLGLGQAAYKGAKSAIDYNKELKRIDNIKGITDQQREEMRAKAKSEFVAEKVQAIDRLAAGTTGSAMMALGVLLSSLGVISITKKKDKGSQFESALGRNSYSLNIGDLSIDLSAFSPAAVPFIMGAELNDNIKNNEAVSVSDVINMLCEVVDPISEMSMVSGIADALKTNSYNNGDASTTTWASDIAKNAVSSYIGQFVPTALGQLTRTFDPYQRSYSAGDDYFASRLTGSSDVGNAVKSLQNKTPLAALSEPKVNLHGDEQRNFNSLIGDNADWSLTNLGAWFLNALNNNVLPATIKVDAKNDIDDELIRLYDAVDSDDLFPTKPSRNLGSQNNVTYKITDDAEYTQYQKEYGQTVYDMLEEFMLSKSYKQMNDTQRAEAIEKIISEAYTSTRKRWKAIYAAKAK